ncbi:MAG: hypothetical protein ACFFDU_09845 [Candidatus Thorarchaeota archaeon]
MRFRSPQWVTLEEAVFEDPGDEVSGLVIGKLFRKARFGEIPVFLLFDDTNNRIIVIQAWAKMLQDYLQGGSGRTGVRMGEYITITYHGRRTKKKPPGTFYHVFRRTRSHYISKQYTYPEKSKRVKKKKKLQAGE